MKKIYLILLFGAFATTPIFAQNDSESVSNVAKGTEFTIPVSPAFDLLAVNPSQVTRPTNIREFKVDWSFRSWRLRPNLAIQAQPIWEIFYNRADLKKYQRASPLAKMLSTLDLSAGTIEDDNQVRRVALAAKLNVYRQHDPLGDAKIFEEIDTSYRREQAERLRRINELYYKKDQKRLDPELRKEAAIEWDSLQTVSREAARAQKERIQEIAQRYMQDHWNSSHVDVSFGKMLSYTATEPDSVGNPKPIDGLKFVSDATAFWLNGSLGMGRKVLITGSFRYILPSKSGVTVDYTLISTGIGFRYGSPKFNFFAEYLFNQGNTIDILNGANDDLNISRLAARSLSYGGDWRISRNVLLSYGVRTDYDSDFKFKNLIPTAGVSCMMR